MIMRFYIINFIILKFDCIFIAYTYDIKIESTVLYHTYAHRHLYHYDVDAPLNCNILLFIFVGHVHNDGDGDHFCRCIFCVGSFIHIFVHFFVSLFLTRREKRFQFVCHSPLSDIIIII